MDKLIENAVRVRDQMIMRSPLRGTAAILAHALKLVEETGELAEAMLGVLGQNPRKGVHKTHDDVMKEIIDVMLTAATLGVQLELPNVFAERLSERLDFLAERAER